PMLRVMTMLMQRRRAAGLAAAVLMVMGAPAGVRAEEEPQAPSQTQPAPKRTTKTEVISTEAGGTVPSEPSPPTVAPAQQPELPSADPPGAPTPPTAAPPSDPGAANPATQSSEPPA